MAKASKRQKRRQKFKQNKQTASQESQPKKEKKKSGLKEIYINDYKKLMLIPLILLIISFGILFQSYATTGEFINKGVSIKGGISVTIPTSTLSSSDVKSFLESIFPQGDIETRTLSSAGKQVAIVIEASEIEQETLVDMIKLNYGLSLDDFTVEVTGSSLGHSFYKQIITAIILAFLFMGALVFFYFRNFVPSLAIILAAFSDMIITLAVISFLDVRITTAGIAAFLMLIGYSVDTDILLTNRVLKRKEGTVVDRTFSAMKTGMTMNITTLIAIIISLIVSESEVLKQIMLILLIGLLADIVNTWIQNAGLLRWYLERKAKNE
ncbi:protein translocase subunit SecF [Candidatus Woesearchaeota archaeon]|nr:protein translocase subunit SecF [Candidatus Woesearchaeota archaeon]